MPFLRPALTVLSLACLTFLAGAATAPATAPAPSSPPRYADPTYNLSFATPTFAPTKERTVVATFQAPAQDGFTPNVTLVVDPGTTTREAYIETSIKQLAESNPRYAMQHIDKPQVSGRDAAVLEYDFSINGRRLRFLQLAVFAEDRVYILTCTAPVDSYKKFEAEFHKVVDSFRLEGVAAGKPI